MNFAAAVAALAAALMLASCSKVTQENFAKIQDGMTEQEVSSILGSPAESSSGSILGVSGTSSVWKDDGTTITVRFVNGKVAMKSFDKPGAGK